MRQPTRYEALIVLWKNSPDDLDRQELLELVGLQNARVSRLETEKEPTVANTGVLSGPGGTAEPSTHINPHLRLEALRRERERVYGETGLNFRTIGMGFTAHVEAHYRLRLPHPIPPHVAANMLVSMKSIRACGPVYHEDNYDDAHNFLSIAQDFDYRKPNANSDDRVLYGGRGDNTAKPDQSGSPSDRHREERP